MRLFISGPLFAFLFHHWQQWLMIPAALKKHPLLCVSALEPRPRTSFCPVRLRSAYGSLCATSSVFLTLQGQRGDTGCAHFPPTALGCV